MAKPKSFGPSGLSPHIGPSRRRRSYQIQQQWDCLCYQCNQLQMLCRSTSSPGHFHCVLQVNQQAMAPTHGAHAASWKSAASKAATCGVWRCTALPPRRTSPARNATQTRRERLRPAAQATKRTRVRSVGRHSSQTRQKTKG